MDSMDQNQNKPCKKSTSCSSTGRKKLINLRKDKRRRSESTPSFSSQVISTKPASYKKKHAKASGCNPFMRRSKKARKQKMSTNSDSESVRVDDKLEDQEKASLIQAKSRLESDAVPDNSNNTSSGPIEETSDEESEAPGNDNAEFENENGNFEQRPEIDQHNAERPEAQMPTASNSNESNANVYEIQNCSIGHVGNNNSTYYITNNVCMTPNTAFGDHPNRNQGERHNTTANDSFEEDNMSNNLADPEHMADMNTFSDGHAEAESLVLQSCISDVKNDIEEQRYRNRDVPYNNPANDLPQENNGNDCHQDAAKMERRESCLSGSLQFNDNHFESKEDLRPIANKTKSCTINASNFHSMPWWNAGLPYSHKKKIECHPHSQTLPSYRPNVGNWKKLKGRILSWPILTRSSYTGQTNGTSYKEEAMEMQSLHQENTV
ncbi:uncharacterized protein LOC143447358 isoform X2 [Clavelina lepadiformis]|uniref:uncharacterized protein LOC143447358 isoform X2 n=1 Tax=Clavelina lepadiformis TaxID=159417 RepID=UPI0040428E6A